jgi:signal transduction histidine kinase
MLNSDNMREDGAGSKGMPSIPKGRLFAFELIGIGSNRRKPGQRRARYHQTSPRSTIMQNLQNNVPMQRIMNFKKMLDLSDEDCKKLAPHQEAFTAYADDFAEFFYDRLLQIEETRRICEIMESRGGLRKNWRLWFKSFFSDSFDENFSKFLWSSGVLHVERGIDQRWINLGYCIARGYVSEMVRKELAAEKALEILPIIDKMLDMCLLIATDAFVESTVKCDHEVMNGIAHQVRNPVAVIGGLAKNLSAKENGGERKMLLDAVYMEAKRLENMVSDVDVYISLYQRKPLYKGVRLMDVIKACLAYLEQGPDDLRIEQDIQEEACLLNVDEELTTIMFEQLLRNSLEAVEMTDDKIIRISARAAAQMENVLLVEIFNGGTPPNSEVMEHLFTPFSSSKPLGSGFGLPIARLAVQKNHGKIDLEPVPGKGTRVVVSLPRLHCPGKAF